MVRIDEVTPFQGGAIVEQGRQAAAGQSDVALRAGALLACEDEAAAAASSVLQSVVEVEARLGRVVEAVRSVTSPRMCVGSVSRRGIMLTSARISQGLSASGVRRRAWQAVSRAGRVRSRLGAEGRRGEVLTAQGAAGVDL